MLIDLLDCSKLIRADEVAHDGVVDPRVSCGEAADDSRAGDGGVGDGDHVLEFGFEDAVEVFGGADGDEGV